MQQLGLFGYPRDESNGYFQYLTRGKIESSYTNWFKFTGNVSGGMSGGPVMLENENNVVGVASEKYNLQEAGKAWRMTNDVILLIIDIRNGNK